MLREQSADPDDPTRGLPDFVVAEYEAFLACADPARGFARLRCAGCGQSRILPFSCKTRTLCPSCSARRMTATAAFLVERVLPDVAYRQWVMSPPFVLVALLGARAELLSALRKMLMKEVFRCLDAKARRLGIATGRSGAACFLQRFSSSLLLFPHIHSVVLDGVYTRATPAGPVQFHTVAPPTHEDTVVVANAVARRFARLLARRGFVHDPEDDDTPLTPLDRWYAGVLAEPASLAIVDDDGRVEGARRPRTVSEDHAGGFSVHARVTVDAGDREGLERLCKYGARPPLADAQLSETADGRIAVRMRKPRPAGQTHVVLDPVRLLRRLAWLIPPPRKNQLTFHGVLAPNARWRRDIVPGPARAPDIEAHGAGGGLFNARSACAIPWKVLIARSYDLDALHCERCGGQLRPIAVITDEAVAKRILRHLGLPSEPARFAPARAPP